MSASYIIILYYILHMKLIPGQFLWKDNFLLTFSNAFIIVETERHEVPNSPILYIIIITIITIMLLNSRARRGRSRAGPPRTASATQTHRGGYRGGTGE